MAESTMPVGQPATQGIRTASVAHESLNVALSAAEASARAVGTHLARPASVANALEDCSFRGAAVSAHPFAAAGSATAAGGAPPSCLR